MPNWESYVRERLPLRDLRPEDEDRIIRETATYLEEFYRDARLQGRSPSEAEDFARGQIDDWEDFAAQIRRSAPSAFQPSLDRWTDRAESRTGRTRWTALPGELFSDLLHAIRALRANPLFSLIVFLSLALGIGAATAIFTVVNAVLIDPLPYPDSDRLVEIWHTAPGADIESLGISQGVWYHYRDLNQVFEGVAAYGQFLVTLTGQGTPDRIMAATVTPDFVPLFVGRPPTLGRMMDEGDGKPGAERVVVISHGMWSTRFGQEPGILGRPLMLNGNSYTVIGVMPPQFDFPSPECHIWLAMGVDTTKLRLGQFNSSAVARLRPGVTREDAEANLRHLIPRLEERFPGPAFDMIVARGRLDVRVTPLKARLVGNFEQRLWLLLAAVCFVLVIACSNVANLFLVRAERRRRELGVRVALGAGPGRLIRHFLSESMLLSFLGGVGALLLAATGVELLVRWAPAGFPRLHEVGIGGDALLFAGVLSATASLLFGAMPLIGQRKSIENGTLSDGSRGATMVQGRARTLNFLVVAEVALAMVLLIGAGLMLRTFRQMQRVDPGFETDGVLTLLLSLPGQDAKSAALFHKRVAERLRSLPGVRSVGAINCLPLAGCGNINPLWEKGVESAPGEIPPAIRIRRILPDYFESLHIPLVAGRLPTRQDRKEQGAATVSRALAQRFWPGEDPIGKQVYPNLPSEGTPWYTVVGVVEDVLSLGLTEGPSELIYLPVLSPDGTNGARSLFYTIQGTGNPLELSDPARKAIWELDPNLPIMRLGPLDQLTSKALAPATFTLILLSIAAAVALTLGAIGVYGVLSFRVGQRTGEIGIRMALGASAAQMRLMVLGRGLVLTVLGVLLGLVGAVALTRFMSTVLFGVKPLDATTYAAVALGLVLIALLASDFPARRAASVDPINSLRSE